MGIVFSGEETYQTAFVEAFPKTPKTFIRGEGETIAEAEKDAWEQLQKYSACNHPSFERRGYTNGAGLCMACDMFKSSAFEPTTKCCVCDSPTNFATDINGKWYCKAHPVPDELEFPLLKSFRKLRQ